MLQFSFEDSNNIVEFYPYRKAMVAQAVTFDLDDFDVNVVLKRYLEEQGYKKDNHICWKTAEGLYFQYSDGTLYVGLSIIK